MNYCITSAIPSGTVLYWFIVDPWQTEVGHGGAVRLKEAAANIERVKDKVHYLNGK